MKALLLEPLFWAPRILCLLVTAFLSMFALDVFDGNRSVGETAVALLMHLIPTFLLLALLALAWRRDWFGAVAFPILGALYIITAWGRFPGSTYAIIAGPLFVVGALFWLNWRRKTPSARLQDRRG